MNKIQQLASIAFLEGMAEEIRNFDISSSDPVEFIKHLKEMANIVSEESSGSHLYDEPEETYNALEDVWMEGKMSQEEAMRQLKSVHDKLREGGWTAFLFASLVEKSPDDCFNPFPLACAYSIEECDQIFDASMMNMAAREDPVLMDFIKMVCQIYKTDKREQKAIRRARKQQRKTASQK